MPDDNKTIVRRIINDVINTGNLAQADALFAPNYVYHGAGGLELRGPEGFKQLINTYRGAFPDMRITIDDLIAEDDKVVVRWTARGTHQGELTGIAPTGKAVALSGIIVSRLSNGKVVEEFETFDEVSLLRQLGVSTLPAVAATT